MKKIELNTNDELIKSLRLLGISDEEISKSLTVKKSDDEDPDEDPDEDEPTDEKDVKKSVKKSMKKFDDESKDDESTDEKIKKAEAVLEDLKKIKKAEKFAILGSEEKFDEIEKSLTSRIEDSTTNFNNKFENLVILVKSLTDTVVSLKDDNTILRKSLSGSEEILNKLAQFSPGLRSVSNPKYIERFEKSETEDGKEIMSISRQKDEISSKLSTKMEDPAFIKSFGSDIASFECSNKISSKLEKAINDELGIKLVQ